MAGRAPVARMVSGRCHRWHEGVLSVSCRLVSHANRHRLACVIGGGSKTWWYARGHPQAMSRVAIAGWRGTRFALRFSTFDGSLFVAFGRGTNTPVYCRRELRHCSGFSKAFCGISSLFCIVFSGALRILEIVFCRRPSSSCADSAKESI